MPNTKVRGEREGQATPRGIEPNRQRRRALTLAGRSVGRFNKGPKDLSSNKKHLEGFGE